jgi:DNA-binding CsgD family transcriptional regulator
MVPEAGSGELLERERSLVAADSALGYARDGDGAALLIEGPAGIGKTSLLEAARQRADGFVTLRAGGGEFERDLPLGVVRQLFEPVLWRATDAERDRWLRGPSATAARLMGVSGAGAQPEGERSVPSDAAAVRSAFYWLAVALGEDSPLVLLIDDLHWADRESLQWLLFALRRLGGTGIAAIMTTRLGEPAADEALLEGVAALPAVAVDRLAPLSAGAVTSFASTWFDASPAPEFAAACHELSGGNPFLLCELVREASRAGVAPDAEGARLLETLVPEGLARTVPARVQALGEGAVVLARAFAVMGSQAAIRNAAVFADLSVEEASVAVGALVRAEVLRDGERLELAHPLLRTAILGELTSSARAVLHARAAKVLAADGAAAELVGAHLLLAAPSGDHWAVERLLLAAEGARDRGAPEAAARLLQRALEEPPAATQLAAVHSALGSARATAGDAGGIDNVRIARELTADPVERATLALRLGGQYFFLGAGEDCSAMMRAALEELGDRAPKLAFLLRASLAGAPAAGARFDPRPLIGELLEEARELDERDLFVRVGLSLLAITACAGAWPAAVVAATARRSIGDLEAHRAAVEAGFPLLPALQALGLAEEGDRLEDRFALIEDGVRRRGALALGLSLSLDSRARLDLHHGALDAAVDRAGAACSLTAEAPFSILRASSLVTLAAALRSRGDLREAELAISDRPADERGGVWAAAAHGELAQIALERADHTTALREALWAGELADRVGGFNPAVAPWRSFAALASRAVGEVEHARRLAAEQLQHASAFGAPATVGAALRVKALVLDDVELLAEAERTLAGSVARLEHARSLVDLGAALRRRGERKRSREPLTAGMEIAHDCDARALVERAMTELRAAGARPRRIVRTGVDALTPSERRIAELAARGHSNREIGGELFITKATVETHLHSIFLKLGVRSRDELASWLGTS